MNMGWQHTHTHTHTHTNKETKTNSHEDRFMRVDFMTMLNPKYSFGVVYYFESSMPTDHTTQIIGSECLPLFSN